MKGLLSFTLLLAVFAAFAIFGLAIIQASEQKHAVDDFNVSGHAGIPTVVNQSAIGEKIEPALGTLFGVLALIAAIVLVVIALLSIGGAAGRSR